jgi:hypothetical protein
MISFLYDPANYLTDEEYLKHNRKRINVQSIVEKPRLYILGQSPSTDLDQLSYTDTRLEDLPDSNTTNIISK